MSKMKQIIGGVIGGMAGGVAVALALAAMQRMQGRTQSRSRGFTNSLRQAFLTRTMPRMRSNDRSALGRLILQSAVLGGAYGGLRAALNLPGFLFGPVFGLASYGLSRAGIDTTAGQALGPWNRKSNALAPRLITHTVYGTVTHMVSEQVQNLLS